MSYTGNMKCPNDQATLLITDRSGIEIDYCPECRGVWLDRGELDKLIERNRETPVAASRYDERPPAPSHKPYDDKHDDRRPYRKKRRESFLEDLFDF